MMRSTVLTVAMFVSMGTMANAASLGGGSENASPITGNLSVRLGVKLLNSDWKDSAVGMDLSSQGEWGVMADARAKSWPINIAIDYLASEKDQTVQGVIVKGKTSELAFGVRKYFMEETFARPYVEAGLANVTAKEELLVGQLDVSTDKSKVGPWVGGGIKFNPLPYLNLGVDARYSYAKPDFNGTKIQAGGYHVAGFVGVAF